MTSNRTAAANRPALVTFHLWGVPTRQIPSAVLAMARDRPALARTPGLQFAKLLGTGSGASFSPGDADPRHWGILASWSDGSSAQGFESSALIRRWDRRADERLTVDLQPLTSKGRWSGQQPFGDPSPCATSGPVAALTRARIKPHLWRTFWRSVPPVSASLNASAGLLMRIGIGEAPVGLQGTFSVWQDASALSAFAYREPEHAAVIRRTRELGWYAEELFARFVVLDVRGTYQGASLVQPAN